MTNREYIDPAQRINSSLGSHSVYGFALPGTDETGVFNPINDYGRAKMQAEVNTSELEDGQGTREAVHAGTASQGGHPGSRGHRD